MAGSFNKVMLMGNLTRDIELRHTSGNTAVAKIGIAVNRKYRVGEGENREMREEVTFVECEAWGRTAETMSQYLHKGKPVFIEGRLKLDQWQDKDGNNRSKLLVVVENFQFVDSRGDSGDSGGGGGGGSGGSTAGTADRGGSSSYESDSPPMTEDDIPF